MCVCRNVVIWACLYAHMHADACRSQKEVFSSMETFAGRLLVEKSCLQRVNKQTDKSECFLTKDINMCTHICIHMNMYM